MTNSRETIKSDMQKYLPEFAKTHKQGFGAFEYFIFLCENSKRVKRNANKYDVAMFLTSNKQVERVNEKHVRENGVHFKINTYIYKGDLP